MAFVFLIGKNLTFFYLESWVFFVLFCFLEKFELFLDLESWIFSVIYVIAEAKKDEGSFERNATMVG